MDVVLVSNDLIHLGFVELVLRDAGIGSVVLDSAISAAEGGIGALPRRLAVAEADAARARRVLAEAGLA